MSQFPLYNSLLKDIPKEDLSVIEKHTFIKRVGKIDKMGTN